MKGEKNEQIFRCLSLIDLSDYEVIWHRTAILRVTAQRPEVAANEEVDPSAPSKRLQRTRDRFSDVAADERFAQHVGDPCGLRAFAQLRIAVAAHEYD